MISQVFLLSPRGDAVIFKDFRGDIPKTSAETFFRKARFWSGPDGGDAPPAFFLEGVHFVHVRTGGLWWVAAAKQPLSPSLAIELLLRIAAVARDVLGSVAEDVVRRNFLVVYELLDEVMDFGLPQSSSTDRLKRLVRIEPQAGRTGALAGVGAGGGRAADVSAAGSALGASSRQGALAAAAAAAAGGGAGGLGSTADVMKSVLATARTGARDEIFVDVIERLSATFDAGGRLRSSSIAGAIRVKSYLGGNPAIRLALSERLVLASDGGGAGARYRHPSPVRTTSADAPEDPVVLDAYSVHEGADVEAFENERVLSLAPPEGQFSLLTYTSSRPFRPPLIVTARVHDDAYSAEKLTLRLAIRANFPPSQVASAVRVVVPLPRGVERAHITIEDRAAGGDLPGPGEGAASASRFGGFGSAGSAGRRARAGAASPASARLASLAGGPKLEQRGEWLEGDRQVVWSLANVRGGRELALTARLSVAREATDTVRRTYGPVSVHFVLPGKPSASGLDVRYLRIEKDDKGYNPARWFRVVCTANNYQIRPHAV